MSASSHNIVEIIIKARDQMSAELRKARGAQDELSKSVKSGQNIMASATRTVAGYAGAYFGFQQLKDTVNVAAQFGEKMAFANTIARKSGAEFEAMTRKVRDIKTEFGLLGTSAPDALYNIYSVLGETGKNLDILEKSAMASVAGMVDINEAAISATSAMKAMGLGADQANRIFEVQFKTIERGKLVYQDIAQYTGQFLGSAAAAGQDYEKVMGLYATLTKSLGNAAMSATSLNQALATFTSAEFEKKMRVMGISVTDAAGNFRDFDAVLKDLYTQLGKMDEGKRAKLIEKLFPGEESKRAILAIVNNFEEAMDDIAEFGEITGKNWEKIFEEMKDTSAFQMRQAAANVEELKIAFGTELAPVVTEVFGDIVDWLKRMRSEGKIDEWSAEVRDAARQVYDSLTEVWAIVVRLYTFMSDNKYAMQTVAIYVGIAVAVSKLTTAYKTAMAFVALFSRQNDLAGKSAQLNAKYNDQLAASTTRVGRAAMIARTAVLGLVAVLPVALQLYTDWLDRDTDRKLKKMSEKDKAHKTVSNQARIRNDYQEEFELLRKLNAGEIKLEDLPQDPMKLQRLSVAAQARAQYASDLGAAMRMNPDEKQTRVISQERNALGGVSSKTETVNVGGADAIAALNAKLKPTGISGQDAAKLAAQIEKHMEARGIMAPFMTGEMGSRNWTVIEAPDMGDVEKAIKKEFEESLKGTASPGAEALLAQGGGKGAAAKDKQKSYDTSEGLKLKGGAEAKGKAQPGTYSLAHYLQDQLGITRFTAFKDALPEHQKGAHAAGLGMDFTLNNPRESRDVEAYIARLGKEAGVNLNIWNEYIKTSKGKTADHMHVAFASKDDAEKFRKWFAGVRGGVQQDAVNLGEFEWEQEIADMQRQQVEAMGNAMRGMLQGMQDGYEQTRRDLEQRIERGRARRDIALEANAPDEFNLPLREAQLNDWRSATEKELGKSESINRLYLQKLNALHAEHIEWKKQQDGYYAQYTYEQLDRMVQDTATKEEEKLRIREEINRRIAEGEIGLNEAYKQGARGAFEAFESYQTKMLCLGRETVDGLESAFGDSFVAAFRGDIDSLADVWDNFLNSMVNAYVRSLGEMAAQEIMGGMFGGGGGFFGGGKTGGVIALLASMFGGRKSGGAQASSGTMFAFANGGIAPGHLQRIRAFASGGVVKEPTLALVREAGQNEAIVPLPDGRSIPVILQDRGGSGGTEIHNHYQFNISTDDAQSFLEKRGDIIAAISQDVAARVAPAAVQKSMSTGGPGSEFFVT
jgi:TP901 family phage tail tape measure protein